MAKFRVELDISFDKEDDAISFLNLLQYIKSMIFKGTGNEKIHIIKYCRYHECFHDENPPKQCGNYTHFDLTKVDIEEVKNKKGEKIEKEELLK